MATQDMLEFAIVLHREIGKKTTSAYASATVAHKLIRAATSLHKRYEAACSYEWATTEDYERQTERKEAAVTAMLAPYGITAAFQRDPRGAPIKLVFPSGITNDWGSEGYCVPTREGK